jgi:GSH-dependent disulfide-bond oxidoreductase
MAERNQDSNAKLILYGADTGNCRRAAIGLSEAGLSYKVERIDLKAGGQFAEPLKTLNPSGKVPVLEIREAGMTSPVILTQSAAILFFAAAKQPRLLPAEGHVERLTVLDAFFFFLTEVIGPNGAAFQLRTREAQPEAAAALTRRYLVALSQCEKYLSAKGFMGGSNFSIADIAGFTIIESVKSDMRLEESPRLADWHARIANRPSVIEGLRAFETKAPRGE